MTDQLIRPLSLRVFLDNDGDLRAFFDGRMGLVIEWLADAVTLSLTIRARRAAQDRESAERALATGADDFGRDAKQFQVTDPLWCSELLLDSNLCERVAALLTDEERAKLAHDIDCLRRQHPLVIGPAPDLDVRPYCDGCGQPFSSGDLTVSIGSRLGFDGETPFSEPPDYNPHYCFACISAACEAMRAARNS
jgi:hypothetical protein